MDINQNISSVIPPPTSQEELRRLWSYNNQHRFTTNRYPISRPDCNHKQVHKLRQVPIIRQVPIHRPYLNLRPDLYQHLRPALYPAPFHRQPQPPPRPALNFPPSQEWIWVLEQGRRTKATVSSESRTRKKTRHGRRTAASFAEEAGPCSRRRRRQLRELRRRRTPQDNRRTSGTRSGGTSTTCSGNEQRKRTTRCIFSSSRVCPRKWLSFDRSSKKPCRTVDIPESELETNEPGITDTAPPDFVTSPSTPRTHPRYEFRPSPSRTREQPEDLSPHRQSLEDAFQPADEALFGPRLMRRQREPLPDDVLHQYPPESKKK